MLNKILEKVPAVGKVVQMLLNSRKAQAVLMGILVILFKDKLGVPEAQAAEFAQAVMIMVVALVGAIAYEDGQAKKGKVDNAKEDD